MTDAAGPTISVVVVSRDRPDSLSLTLRGLSRLFHDTYEIIVVGDAAALDAVRRLGLTDRIKTVAFADPNISEARNLGIAVAAGEIVAFIDDDAVPEPTWLRYLTAPFAEDDVSAVGGFVRGRNGISFQWKAHSIDRAGRSWPLDLGDTSAVILSPPPHRAIKTEGTNMAFRRADLERLGGFDSAYRFYLDEADLNMRLARAGLRTAIAPLAQVHHAFAPSSRRLANRAPRDLFEIGASLAVFLRRHCPTEDHAAALETFTEDQDRSLLTHMVAGRLEPREVTMLRNRLAQGIAAGRSRPLGPLPSLPHSRDPYLPFRSEATGPSTTLAGRPWHAERLRDQAAAAAKAGQTVSLFLMSPTTLFHDVKFRGGYWEQRGGTLGRSDRTDPLIRLTGFRRRLRREIGRVALLRGLNQ
ncbi:glycosyltransferase family 2 protein [Pseudooceanicola sp. C21-150M6]|uniref:glycosyltransferase family 2 protein n=1 Tax=Pseudooceanicola sp. C21-150M6 TaxID=3434355 RepID=UPI003D7F351F